MSVALLDVNVLVALLDPAHTDHEYAHRWFGRHRKYGWASCPITINGVTRVLSNPAYPTVDATPADVLGRLKVICAAADHHIWDDSARLTDETLFRQSLIAGHQKITDVYLLGLAVRNHGRLATFDRSLPLEAVVGATQGSVTLIARN
jgi:toxin-antitoxin system PIN domain toxin